MFTQAFIITALETALVAGVTAFTGALAVTTGTPSLRDLEAAGVAAGMAALYSFIKAFGVTQDAKAKAAKAAK